MPFKIFAAAFLSLLFFACLPLNAQEKPTTREHVAADFEFSDTERIILLGDGLVEQEQYFGWIELALTTAEPSKSLKFRNLGWNGDTPAGQSRFGLSLLQAGREPADEGWKQLQLQIEQTQPTIVILGYGMASALENGESGIEQFREDYNRLLATIAKLSPGCRFIHLSPVARSDSDAQRSQALALYTDAIRDIASATSAPFVNLIDFTADEHLHKDPIHLNSSGYRVASQRVCETLGLPSAQLDNALASSLQEVILRKNEWWFHRSRPANMAYVFGFRKQEQGQNAIEIPQYDSLIEAEETTIARLRSLEPADVPSPESRTESKFAEFTPQATPEFTVADGWEVTLWAENPQLNKPIHMNFDSQGRLWVVSSEAYPMIEVGQSAPDKVIVLEDTDQDGQADKSTVFADGLLIPTGVVPGNGGVYVAQSTDLLFLKDTDGDGKADSKQRVLSGFGTEDTHHNLHTLLWGPDGRLYMNQSVYTRTDAETPFGVTRLKAGGGFRVNASSLQTSIFFRGLWNSWGHQFDRYGNSFLSDGAGFDGLAYTFPGAQFNPTPNARQQLGLISPGRYPKFASEEIIYGDSFPPEWQGSIVTCDFRANRVTRFSLVEQGAGFATQQEADLLRTSAATFRPIDVKQGPDGALYIADWSNPIINHGEVDFRDARRDRWHGRIWRVVWKGGVTEGPANLAELSNTELLDNLLENDRYKRDLSRRVLAERGNHTDRSALLGELSTWSERQNSELASLEALWLHQALNIADHARLTELLSANDSRIRTAAVRILSDWCRSDTEVDQPVAGPAALELLTAAVHDETPRVRLEAVRALALLDSAAAGIVALQALDSPMDRFLEHALWLTTNELSAPLAEQLLADLLQGKPQTLSQDQLAFFLTAIEPSSSVAFLDQYLKTHKLASDGSGSWIELIGKAGNEAQLTQLYAQAAAGGFDDGVVPRVLDTIADANRLRKLRPAALPSVERLLNSPSETTRLAALRLVGQLRLVKFSDAVASIASMSDSSPESYSSAVNCLAELGSDAAKQGLQSLIASRTGAQRTQAVLALSKVDATAAAPAFMTLLQESSSEETARDLWRGFLQGKDSDAVAATTLPNELSELAARAGLRVLSEGRDSPQLAEALKRYAGNMNAAVVLTPELSAELAKLVADRGDPHRGEEVYRRQTLACNTCHAIGGVGGKVGPDMTSLGASAPVDYIIESLFMPDAKIKEGYHSTIVMTDSGQVFTGVEVSDANGELVLRNANNELVRIPTDEIENRKSGPSLMPTGVIDRLTRDEQVDLIAFLTQLGKPGDFDAARGGAARVYQVLAGTHRLEQNGTEPIIDGTLSDGWLPFQAKVNGTVAGNSLLEMTKQPIHIALVHVYLRTKVSVVKDEPVSLTIEGANKVAMWIDGKAVDSKSADGEETFTLPLTTGDHTVLLRLDAFDLPESLRLLSSQVTFAVE